MKPWKFILLMSGMTWMILATEPVKETSCCKGVMVYLQQELALLPEQQLGVKSVIELYAPRFDELPTTDVSGNMREVTKVKLYDQFRLTLTHILEPEQSDKLHHSRNKVLSLYGVKF